MPALPLDEAGKYVAAAYVVVFAIVLVYVLIMGVRLARLERDVAELDELADTGQPPQPPAESREVTHT